MAKKIEISGNYLRITDTITGLFEFETSVKNTEFRNTEGDNTFYLFLNNSFVRQYELSELVDSASNPFASKAAFIAWKDENTGLATGVAAGFALVSAATTNATVIKNTSGRLAGWNIANTTASWLYVKLHNTTTAPVVGTTAVLRTIGVPPNSVNHFNIEGGVSISTGLSMSTTVNSVATDATAVAAGALIINIFYA